VISTQKLAVRTSQKPWKDLFANITYWPRSEALANFHLLSGCDRLAKHLYHIGLFPHPYYCTYCDNEKTWTRMICVEMHCFIFDI
jgi:hypothetical protein